MYERERECVCVSMLEIKYRVGEKAGISWVCAYLYKCLFSVSCVCVCFCACGVALPPENAEGFLFFFA